MILRDEGRMYRAGVAELPLHGGKAPRWLFGRMVKLADAIVSIIIDEYGTRELIQRLSNPFFFQALSCVLGFDWHSSGTTTVTCSALKLAMKPVEHGVAVAGGKGSTSRKTPLEIPQIGELFNLSEAKVEDLKYASRMSAKVDNTAIQAGYQLYHHCIFITEEGDWSVIQQGMNPEIRKARRYHWLKGTFKTFVEEPHTAIVGEVSHENVLDMTSRQSEECRKISTDLVNDNPQHLKTILSDKPLNQETLLKWVPQSKVSLPLRLNLLSGVNWKALMKAYQTQPKNYEELLSLRGIGPSTVKALAMISGLIYGKPPSWKDPVKYSFTFGGKDGVPYPVNKKSMDEATAFLKKVVEEAKTESKEKTQALKRLQQYAPFTE